MNLLIWVCLALVAWPSAFALYYTGTKEVFLPPTTNNRNNSYFGYSITYDESKRKLIISAPRLSAIGEVYDCNIENRTCAKIATDVIKRDEGRDGKTYTHDYWFGATVKAGPEEVWMCAPRYTEYSIRKSDNTGFDAYVAHGKCYSYENNVLSEKRTIDESERIKDSAGLKEDTMDSFGWSIDVASDDSVIVGGPGMFHGRAMIYFPSQSRGVPKFIKNQKSTPKFNFGYAVASGIFFYDYLSYAVGSPYGPGEVIFYKAIQQLKFLRKLEKEVDTTLIGSMFGSVLCAAKLIGKRTDLLVGAPTYAEKDTYNKGAVYVYLAIQRTKSPKFHRRIVGKNSGSMFGSAMVNLGDLNGDKRHEIAIGAPFEKDGHGIVYIYSGADIISAQAERDLKWLQKIEPEPTYGESFGMSLTPLLDYDQNGCKELAIGSPYKDTVVLFRCMAAIVVKTSEKFPTSLQGRTASRQEEFEFDVILSVTYSTLPTLVTASISTTVEINHASAKLLDTNDKGRVTFNTTLDKKITEYSKKVRFFLPLDGKYGTEIRYTISSELLNDPRNLSDFQPSRVILSDSSVLNIQKSLWAAECAGNTTCVPKLDLEPIINFYDGIHPYIIGSSDNETMYITMYNDGEVAYDSCVRVHVDGANVIEPGGCVYESSSDRNKLQLELRCEPPKPLWNKNRWTTGPIKLEMNHLTNLDTSINITMILYNRCNDNTTVTRPETSSIPLRADPSGITAKGETDIGTVVSMKEKEIKKDGKKLKHVYTITNNGLTNWEEFLVYVILQTQPFIKYDAVTIYSSSTKMYTICPFKLQNETSMIYNCTVKRLNKKVDFAKILIPMKILPGTLERYLDKDKNATIMSAVKLEITGDNYYRESTESVTSTITLQEAEVPLQTIIIAVGVGLFILIIIALVLYRIGFLQRKKREELQRLQKSVKRQTILRRSTMPSQSSTAEDRKKILEDMKEEDEHNHPPSQI